MASVRSSIRHLQRDLAAVARDAEALLRATADISSDKVQEVRQQTESSLQKARSSLRRARWEAPLREAYETTATYARKHPWAFVGAAAGAVLLFALARRHSQS